MADYTYYCNATDRLGNPDQGVIVITLTPLGSVFNVVIWSTPISITLLPVGSFVTSKFITATPINLTLTLSTILAYTRRAKSNWIKWSNIGSAVFTISRGNVAGERPLDWTGWVYQLKKLGNKVVAYGENGVSLLNPVQEAWSLNTIYRVGLKGKQAVTGTEDIHYFVDKKGHLLQLQEKLELLDYSEYLTNLLDPVLSWDIKNELLYLCDGVSGFVYSAKDKSLGEGPVNITGMGYLSDYNLVIAQAAIVNPAFEVWTDTFDLGTRKGKCITTLKVGVDLTSTLQASIRYRQNKASSWQQTDWVTFDQEGKAWFQTYGQEFRFGVKVTSYEYFELDYLKVIGRVFDLW